jgi:hypothetical protein
MNLSVCELKYTNTLQQGTFIRDGVVKVETSSCCKFNWRDARNQHGSLETTKMTAPEHIMTALSRKLSDTFAVISR